MSNLSMAERPNRKSIPSVPTREHLKRVRIINRILYVNGDPAMNYKLPLDNGWRVNDLADEIMRACVEYDVIANWESARFLALRLVKEILKDKRQINGGFELGWD